jgi:hypothetical protein
LDTENTSSIKRYIALMFYAFKADTLYEVYDRIIEYRYIFHALDMKIEDIDMALEIRYEDFDFTGELKRMVFEYTVMILQLRSDNIHRYAEQVESISSRGNNSKVEEYELLSDFIIAFACEEDSTELRQKFGEYW